jgi:hypothetical protein
MIAQVFNSLAEMLETLSSEFIRVSVQTGKQSKLGAQAEVHDVSGRWGEMVDSLNEMAHVLTWELRRTSTTARAWAEGDMNQRLTPDRIAGELAQMQQHLDEAALRWTAVPHE